VGRASLIETTGSALRERPVMTVGGGSLTLAGRADASAIQWGALLDHVNWTTGRIEALPLQVGLNIRAIAARVAAAQAVLAGRSFADIITIILLVIAVLFLFIEIGALATGLALARSITGAVHELFAGTERVRQGDFGHRILVRTQDQLGELADSFNQMTASIEELLRVSAEKKRLEEEMRLAREIQMSLLPRGPLAVPGARVTAGGLAGGAD
jgi:methyl-accepting chemotaxis protein